MSKLEPKIVLSRLEAAHWTRKGLRAFLEYRDLGLSEATGGRFGATIGRAIQKFEPGGGAKRHTHDTTFHLIFVMRGWLRTEFEGLGELVLRQGDCIAYQGEIPQEHVEYSDDFEVMQIASPADYRTESVEARQP
jgi:quercetin dioxygenase-like cupin family protein